MFQLNDKLTHFLHSDWAGMPMHLSTASTPAHYARVKKLSPDRGREWGSPCELSFSQRLVLCCLWSNDWKWLLHILFCFITVCASCSVLSKAEDVLHRYKTDLLFGLDALHGDGSINCHRKSRNRSKFARHNNDSDFIHVA